MRVHEFDSAQWLPLPREQIFDFFSDAANLDAITPRWLRFRTLTPAPVVMRAGTLIDYNLRIRGIPIRWRTRIDLWEPPFRFVDEQVSGPYRLWVHEHTFVAANGGTLMRDRVRYAVPLDPLVHRMLVRPEIERIFAYRTEQMHRRFAAPARVT
jgi:ligand-binding SRPBCC domain-containing protein